MPPHNSIMDWWKNLGKVNYTAPETKPANPYGVDMEKGTISGYDFKNKWAAENKGHIQGVADIYSQLKDLESSTDSPPNNPYWVVQGDIGKTQQLKKKQTAPISADMIYNSAQKYGVDPLLFSAMIRQDSSYGLEGMGVKDKNPTNWGTWGNQRTSFNTWQEGLDAAAKHLSGMRPGINSQLANK